MSVPTTGAPVPGGRTSAPPSSSLKGLMKDKRAWAVVGVGGVAGLVVLMKRGGSGSTSAESAAGSGIQNDGSGAFYDSTSSDVANQLGQYQTGLQTALGQYSASQQEQLNAFQKSLTDSLAGTKGTSTTGTSGASTAKSLAPGYGWFATGSNKNVTLAQLASKYGTSVDALKKLNPSYTSYGANTKLPVNKPIKVRSNASAWNLAAYRKVNK